MPAAHCFVVEVLEQQLVPAPWAWELRQVVPVEELGWVRERLALALEEAAMADWFPKASGDRAEQQQTVAFLFRSNYFMKLMNEAQVVCTL